MYKTLTFIFCVALITACSTADTSEKPSTTTPPPKVEAVEVSPEEFNEFIQYFTTLELPLEANVIESLSRIDENDTKNFINTDASKWGKAEWENIYYERLGKLNQAEFWTVMVKMVTPTEETILLMNFAENGQKVDELKINSLGPGQGEIIGSIGEDGTIMVVEVPLSEEGKEQEVIELSYRTTEKGKFEKML